MKFYRKNQPFTNKTKQKFQVHSYNSYAGDMIGGLSVLTSETCQYTVRARHHTKVAILSRTSVYKCVFVVAVSIRLMQPKCFYCIRFFCSSKILFRSNAV